MKEGKCPKCKSDEVVTTVQGGGVGFGANVSIALGNSWSTTANWISYLCLSCGYFENYVADQKQLDKIRTELTKMGWKKVRS